MNVLVLAPHPDDESIGCGGTIRLHHDRGDRVHVVYLTSGELGLPKLDVEDAQQLREAEAARAAKVLGVAQQSFLRFPDLSLASRTEDAVAALVPVLRRETPSTVYLPHRDEAHPDHAAAFDIATRAVTNHLATLPTLLSYEIWTPLPDWYHVEDITRVVGVKLRAIRCHRSQVAQLAYDWAAHGLAKYRGATAGGCRYAEIFQTVTVP